MRELLDFILPRKCAVCGCSLVGKEGRLCTRCAVQIPLTYFWTTEHNPMSEKLNARIEDYRLCHGITSREGWNLAFALYFYKGGYRNISKALKYRADIATGRYIAGALARRIRNCRSYDDADWIVPVPLHWTRRLVRGYNQAEVIAKELEKSLGIPCARVLKRNRRTKSQARLRVGEKEKNVKGAFSVDTPLLAELTKEGVKIPRHIILVDDVFTTGSTICECHQCLRKALRDAFGDRKASRIRISAVTLAAVGD